MVEPRRGPRAPRPARRVLVEARTAHHRRDRRRPERMGPRSTEPRALTRVAGRPRRRPDARAPPRPGGARRGRGRRGNGAAGQVVVDDELDDSFDESPGRPGPRASCGPGPPKPATVEVTLKFESMSTVAMVPSDVFRCASYVPAPLESVSTRITVASGTAASAAASALVAASPVSSVSPGPFGIDAGSREPEGG